MDQILLLALKISVAVLILAIGIGSNPADALYLWRRPGKLLRVVLAMYVLVPLAAVLLVGVLPLEPGARATLLVLAVSAGAPLLPRKLAKLGNEAYVYSLVVTSSLLAIVVVPLLVNLMGRHFGVSADPPIAAAIAKTFGLPLAAGALIRLMLRGHSQRVADVLGKIGLVVLALAAVTLVATHWSVFASVRWEGIAILLAMMLISLGIGHVVGGPAPDERTALAVCCATRHVGVAIIVAAAFEGPRAATVIAAYVIASMLVSIPYLKLRSRLSGP